MHPGSTTWDNSGPPTISIHATRSTEYKAIIFVIFSCVISMEIPSFCLLTLETINIQLNALNIHQNQTDKISVVVYSKDRLILKIKGGLL